MKRTKVSTLRSTMASMVMLVSVGCGNDRMNLGDSKADGEGDAAMPVIGTLGMNLTDYSGSWDGYVEAYAFSDGSDRVRLTIADDGSGFVQFGEIELPPPVADKPYPPLREGCYVNSPVVECPDDELGDSGSLAAGFRYSLFGTSVTNRRIQSALWPKELHDEWCSLQTPLALHVDTGVITDGSGEVYYSCTPGTWRCENGTCHAAQVLPDGSSDITYPLTEAQLICHDCECTADGCHLAPMYGTPSPAFDAALEQEGNVLVGTLVLGPTLRTAVRLSRVTQ
jgi:hypothetical protein